MKGALLRYRVMAYVVGCLLVVLVCVGVPLKYLGDNDTVVTWTGIPHGWLYMILIITAFDLGRRARWGWGRLILIALAGTVPFLSFVAEHYATRDVRAKLAVYPEYADQASLPVEAAAVTARNAGEFRRPGDTATDARGRDVPARSDAPVSDTPANESSGG